MGGLVHQTSKLEVLQEKGALDGRLALACVAVGVQSNRLPRTSWLRKVVLCIVALMLTLAIVFRVNFFLSNETNTVLVNLISNRQGYLDPSKLDQVAYEGLTVFTPGEKFLFEQLTRSHDIALLQGHRLILVLQVSLLGLPPLHVSLDRFKKPIH